MDQVVRVELEVDLMMGAKAEVNYHAFVLPQFLLNHSICKSYS